MIALPTLVQDQFGVAYDGPKREHHQASQASDQSIAIAVPARHSLKNLENPAFFGDFMKSAFATALAV